MLMQHTSYRLAQYMHLAPVDDKPQVQATLKELNQVNGRSADLVFISDLDGFVCWRRHADSHAVGPRCGSGPGVGRAEDLQQQQARSDHDAGVGDVEVRPVEVVDAHGEEVDDVVEADAVVEVAERAAKDERQRDRGDA